MRWKWIMAGAIIVLLLVVGIEGYLLFNLQTGIERPERHLIARGTYEDIKVLDGAKASSGNDHDIVLPNVYSGLLRLQGLGYSTSGGEASGFKVYPDLAREWTVSSDGKVWTFYLREGVMFHKGYGEMTADDVEYTFERLKDAELSVWSQKYQNIEGIEVLDKYTILFRLQNASYGVSKGNEKLFACYRGGCHIVSKKAVEEVGSEEYGNPMKLIVGTGPFMVESYKPKENIVLTAHKEYYGGRPWLDKITLKFISDEKVAVLALLNGEVDWLEGPLVGPENLDMLIDDPEIVVGVGYTDATICHNINVAVEPFTDVRVRQALLYALDLPAIVKAVYGEFGVEPATNVFCSMAEGYLGPDELNWLEEFEYNPEKAKSLLADAGYPEGFETEAVTYVQSMEDKLFEAEIEYWEEVGIHVNLKVVDTATWIEYAYTKEAPLINMATMAIQLYNMQYSKGTYVCRNYTGCDELFEQAWAEPDPVERAEIYGEIQRKLLEDVATIPTRWDNPIQAWNSKVKGYEMPVGHECWLYSVYFEEE